MTLECIIEGMSLLNGSGLVNMTGERERERERKREREREKIAGET